MIELKSGFQSVTDKERWADGGASLVAKLKATKAVWFPPEPTKSGKKATSTAKKATKKAAKKATKKSTRKATAAARKSSGGTKRVTKRAPSKKA